MKSVMIKTVDAGDEVYATSDLGRGVYRLDPASRSWVLVRDDTPTFSSLSQFRRFLRRELGVYESTGNTDGWD